MHKANIIINAIVSLLNKLPTVEVVTHRKAIAENLLPATRVLFGKNKPSHVGTNFTDWDLIVYTDIVLTASDDDINAETTDVALLIHQKLMAENALNLAFVQDITPLGQDETVFNTESEITFADVPNGWLIKYRANSQDPSL